MDGKDLADERNCFLRVGRSSENILPELKTVLPNADFVIESYVDPTEPLRDEGPFGDHTGLGSAKCEFTKPASAPV